MICLYEECKAEFIPKTHNQKYCSDLCCRTATNIKIKQKYHEEKERKRGVKRTCSAKGCENTLSRYNTEKVCAECESKITSKNKKDLWEMISNVVS